MLTATPFVRELVFTVKALPVVTELALTVRALAVVCEACKTSPSVVVLVWLMVVVAAPVFEAPNFTKLDVSERLLEDIWLPAT